jgi:hypothetical protein
MTHKNNGPGYLGYLNEAYVTIPEVLKESGSFTAMTGKWHSGAVMKSWPENRGFDRFYGIHHWVDSYFNVLQDCEVFEDGKIVIPETRNPGEYYYKGNNEGNSLEEKNPLGEKDTSGDGTQRMSLRTKP